MNRDRLAILILSLFTSTTLSAQAPARATPTGFDPTRLRRIDTWMQSYVDSNQIGGAVGLVLRDGRVVYQHTVGWIDKESGRRMTANALFRIASQSKAVTTVALLSLVEEGKIGVDDPVSRWIPAFAHTTVAVKSDTGPAIVPAKRQITIRDLLTHTSGISSGLDPLVARAYAAKGLGSEAGFWWYFADKDEPICTTVERLATLPFSAQPGERWIYGYSIDVLGCVAERASGMPLDQLIRERITGPLKMNDTYFYVPQSAAARLVTVYASDSTNHATRAPEGPRGQGNYVTGPRKEFSGGAGLISTAGDYARFLEMLRNGGQLDGVRILAPHTVDLMTHNQVGALYDSSGGRGFGFGFETTEHYGSDGMTSMGSSRWGGAYGSVYYVDPVEHLVIIFMMNQLPNNTDIRDKFQTLVYQALVGSRR
ncbi:MAG TPA: serine hydrolase domain-containing protein [Gemmatimonadales bacterium]|nr:serine hydrolase domain-containing protein [Gemmatimonadales bacterium]